MPSRSRRAGRCLGGLGAQGRHPVPAVPLLPGRYRHILEAELPDVAAAIERDGGLRFNPLEGIPDAIGGGFRDGDERFELLSGRRAVVERAVASVAEETPGLDLRRGVAVRRARWAARRREPASRTSPA